MATMSMPMRMTAMTTSAAVGALDEGGFSGGCGSFTIKSYVPLQTELNGRNYWNYKHVAPSVLEPFMWASLALRNRIAWYRDRLS